VREARENDGIPGKASDTVSAAHRLFQGPDQDLRNCLAWIHTAEVMGSSPVSPTESAQVRSYVALIAAICHPAAECWAAGNVSLAGQWFGAAVEELGDGEFVDLDEHQADR
jgi:hypothetical protein